MKVFVNNQEKNYPNDAISVQQLLDIERPNNQNGIAVAINNVIVQKSKWNEKMINENENVLIITATQGG